MPDLGAELAHSSSGPENRPASRVWLIRGIAIGIALIASAVFLPALKCGFVNYDDADYVTKNAYVLGGLSMDGIRWAMTAGAASNWHPLTWLSLMLDSSLYGTWAGGFHLTSLLLHAANASLVFLFFNRFTDSTWRSALAAMLFAVHPLRVESVAWASERKDVLCAFFFLLALLAYGRYVRGRSIGFYLLTLIWFILSLLAKPMSVTLPCVLILLDVWPLRRLRWSVSSILKIGLLEKLPFFAASAGSCIVTVIVQRGAMGLNEQVPIGARAANAAVAYVRYLEKFLWPTNLVALYPYADHLPGWEIAGCSMLIAGLFIAAWAIRRSRPQVMVGLFWFLGMLVPVIGLLQVGMQSIADRYTYLPQIGLLLAIWLVPSGWFAGVGRKTLIAITSIALFVVLSLATIHQISYWQDGIILFRRAVAIYPKSPLVRTALAVALTSNNQLDEAMQEADEVLRLDPQFDRAYTVRASIWFKRRQYEKSIAECDRAIQSPHPGFFSAAYNSRAAAELMLHRYPEAKADLEKAMALDPGAQAPIVNYQRLMKKMSGQAEAE